MSEERIQELREEQQRLGQAQWTDNKLEAMETILEELIEGYIEVVGRLDHMEKQAAVAVDALGLRERVTRLENDLYKLSKKASGGAT